MKTILRKIQKYFRNFSPGILGNGLIPIFNSGNDFKISSLGITLPLKYSISLGFSDLSRVISSDKYVLPLLASVYWTMESIMATQGRAPST